MSEPDTTDLERLRAALASLDSQDPPVDAERIFEALHGNLSAEDRQAVVEELVRNPGAAEAWRLARELAPEGPASTSAGRGLYTWVSIAAAVLLAAGLGWQLFNPLQPSQEPAYRSVEQRGIASALPTGATLSRAQPVLKWTGVEGARYRVRVLTPELELLEETADITVPEHTLSADVLRRIPSGGQILWQVEARVAGTEGLVSPTFTVRVE